MIVVYTFFFCVAVYATGKAGYEILAAAANLAIDYFLPAPPTPPPEPPVSGSES